MANNSLYHKWRTGFKAIALASFMAPSSVGASSVNLVVQTSAVPEAKFKVTQSTVVEQNGIVNLSVIFSPAFSGYLNYSINGTAKIGEDIGLSEYSIATNGSVEEIDIVIDLKDDRVIEDTETVRVTLEPGTGYKIGSDYLHTVQIADNDESWRVVQHLNGMLFEYGMQIIRMLDETIGTVTSDGRSGIPAGSYIADINASNESGFEAKIGPILVTSAESSLNADLLRTFTLVADKNKGHAFSDNALNGTAIEEWIVSEQSSHLELEHPLTGTFQMSRTIAQGLQQPEANTAQEQGIVINQTKNTVMPTDCTNIIFSKKQLQFDISEPPFDFFFNTPLHPWINEIELGIIDILDNKEFFIDYIKKEVSGAESLLYSGTTGAFRYKKGNATEKNSAIETDVNEKGPMHKSWGLDERQRAHDAMRGVYCALQIAPWSIELQNLLFQIYYDYTVAEKGLAQEVRSNIAKAVIQKEHLNIIDYEIGELEEVLLRYQNVLRGYMQLMLSQLGPTDRDTELKTITTWYLWDWIGVNFWDWIGVNSRNPYYSYEDEEYFLRSPVLARWVGLGDRVSINHISNTTTQQHEDLHKRLLQFEEAKLEYMEFLKQYIEYAGLNGATVILSRDRHYGFHDTSIDYLMRNDVMKHMAFGGRSEREQLLRMYERSNSPPKCSTPIARPFGARLKAASIWRDRQELDKIRCGAGWPTGFGLDSPMAKLLGDLGLGSHPESKTAESEVLRRLVSSKKLNRRAKLEEIHHQWEEYREQSARPVHPIGFDEHALLLLEMLSDYLSAAEELSMRYMMRRMPSDLATAEDLQRTALTSAYFAGNALLNMFPSVKESEDGKIAIVGWKLSYNALASTVALKDQTNLLGYSSNFYLLPQPSEKSGDSFDILYQQAARSLSYAKEQFDNAKKEIESHGQHSDRHALERFSSGDYYDMELKRLIGAGPGEEGYDNFKANDASDMIDGSELGIRLLEVEEANKQLDRALFEIRAAQREIESEKNRREAERSINGKRSNIYIVYGEKQIALSDEIARINIEKEKHIRLINRGRSVAKAAGNMVRNLLNPFKWGNLAGDAVVDSAEGLANELIHSKEIEALGQTTKSRSAKEQLDAIKQSQIVDIEDELLENNFQATLKSLLLDAQRSLINAEVAGSAVLTAVAKVEALYLRINELTQRKEEAKNRMSEMYFADPIHLLNRDGAIIRAENAFLSAQHWLYLAMRTGEYKWNQKFAHVLEGSNAFYNEQTLFTARNARHLESFAMALNEWNDSLNSTYRPDSIKADGYGEGVVFFSMKDLIRQELEEYVKRESNYIDPDDPKSPMPGYKLLEFRFDTVFEDPGTGHFASNRFLERITGIGIRINGVGLSSDQQQMIFGHLSYGGKSVFRNLKREESDFSAYPAMYWRKQEGQWLPGGPFESGVPILVATRREFTQRSNVTDKFNGLSVAATDWRLYIPVEYHNVRDGEPYVEQIVNLDGLKMGVNSVEFAVYSEYVGRH